MPVRDVLWACPLCRTTGAIRPQGRTERCASCGAGFRRGRGARILVRANGSVTERPTGDWLRDLGPPTPPEPGPDGVVLGPEAVRVKFTCGQEPLHWRGHTVGWVELYDKTRRGSLTLHENRLTLLLDDGPLAWSPEDVTGLQPASSSIQLRLGERMASFKFLEGSVRLWTAALMQVLRRHHDACGREIVELQPFVRTRPRNRAPGAPMAPERRARR